MNFLPKILKAIFLGAVLGIFVSYLSAQAQTTSEQWNNWIGDPPAFDTSVPIHAGSDSIGSIKTGPLALNNLIVGSKAGPLGVAGVSSFSGNVTIGFPQEVIAFRQNQLITQGVTGSNLTNTLNQEFGSTLTITGDAYIGLQGDINLPDPNLPDSLVARREFELNTLGGGTIVDEMVISREDFEAENGDVRTQNVELSGVSLSGNTQDSRCLTLCFDQNNLIVPCSSVYQPYINAC